jgi:probable addiction module antidote protein
VIAGTNGGLSKREKERVISTRFSAFDVAGYLDSDEAIAAYLNEVIEENDPDLFLSALADIACARSMSKVAEDSGLGRESLPSGEALG